MKEILPIPFTLTLSVAQSTIAKAAFNVQHFGMRIFNEEVARSVPHIGPSIATTLATHVLPKLPPPSADEQAQFQLLQSNKKAVEKAKRQQTKAAGGSGSGAGVSAACPFFLS